MKEEDLTLSPMAEEDPKASSLKEDDLKNEQDIEGFSIMKVKDPQNIQWKKPITENFKVFYAEHRFDCSLASEICSCKGVES